MRTFIISNSKIKFHQNITLSMKGMSKVDPLTDVQVL